MVGEIIEDNAPSFKGGGEIGKSKDKPKSLMIHKDCTKIIENLIGRLNETKHIYLSLYTQNELEGRKEALEERWEGLLKGTNSLISKYIDFLDGCGHDYTTDYSGYDYNRYESTKDGIEAAIKKEIECLDICKELASKADSKKDYITTSMVMSTLRIHIRCISKLNKL
jgi:hypothetical protein